MKKVCAMCKESKNIDEFGSRGKKYVYVQSYCKKCASLDKRRRIDREPWKQTFKNIRTRCENSNHSSYKNYGAKGIKNNITIEELKRLWERDKAGSMKKASIDRIEHNKDYTLNNCRYIEYKKNSAKEHWTTAQRRELALKSIKTREKGKSNIPHGIFQQKRGL